MKLFQSHCADFFFFFFYLPDFMYKKIEKLRYAISDVMLKCGKELVKTIFYGVWESPLIKSL